VEWLRRVQLVVDVHLYELLVPNENIVEFIPLIFLLPHIQHGVHVEVDLEILVIAKSGEKYGFIPGQWWLPFSILLLILIT